MEAVKQRIHSNQLNNISEWQYQNADMPGTTTISNFSTFTIQQLAVDSSVTTPPTTLYPNRVLTSMVTNERYTHSKSQAHLVGGDMVSIPQLQPPVEACIVPWRTLPMKTMGGS